MELVKQHRYDFVGSYWIGSEGDEWFDYFLPTTVDRINFITTGETGIASGRWLSLPFGCYSDGDDGGTTGIATPVH